MKLEKATAEHCMYGLALLLAAALRFNGLGSVPLSDSEAIWANQAIELARGGHVLLGGQPGYVLLTAASFFLFGTSEFLARFWPALLGTGLVLAPYLYRERLGRSAALVLALVLAAEPVLVAASRQADGRMLAVAGLAFAGGFWLNTQGIYRKGTQEVPRGYTGSAPLGRGWLPGVGIGAGVAVLGGASAWNALLAVSLGCSVVRRTAPKEGNLTTPRWGATIVPWGLGTVIVLGALFGIFPGGLSALMNSLVSYVSGWTGGGPLQGAAAAGPLQGAAAASAGPLLMLTSWTLLSPLAIVFGLTGLVRGWLRHDLTDQALAWVWLFLFVLVLLYPQRQTVDLAYAVVPLLAMGARQALRVFVPLRGNLTVYAYALLVAVLGVSIWMGFSGFVNFAMQDNALRWGGIAGAAILLLVSLLLVGWGWDWKAAWVGFSCGLSTVLLVFTLATAWSSAGMNNRPGMELWVNGAYPSEQNLALKVLGDISEWQTGHRDGLDIAVSGADTPSLRWALRNFRNLSFVSTLAPDTKISAIITSPFPGTLAVEKQGATLGLTQPYPSWVPLRYTGQGLDWAQTVLWPELLPQDWLGWFFYRELSNRPDILSKQSVILWLRSDLFPGAAKTGVGR